MTTKKTFNEVCKIIRKQPLGCRRKLAEDFTVKFSNDNPRFDTVRFMQCVVK